MMGNWRMHAAAAALGSFLVDWAATGASLSGEMPSAEAEALWEYVTRKNPSTGGAISRAYMESTRELGLMGPG